MKRAQQDNEITPDTVLSALQGRIGAANGITATKLVIFLTDNTSAAAERRLRDCVVYLRTQGHPVCASTADGYFIAANDQELNETCKFLYDRAMTGLQQAYALKKKALPDLAGQLGLSVTTDQEEPNHAQP